MKHRIFTLFAILMTLIVITACGGGSNLQATVAAQNTQIAKLSGTSAPAPPQQTPTHENSTNETSPTASSIQSSENTLVGSFPIINGLIGYPISHTVGDENSYSDGFRKVYLELFIQNTSTSLANPGIVIAGVHAKLIDSNQFTQQCLIEDIQKLIAGLFPPNFGVPYVLSCQMPNNASPASFTVTINGNEMSSFPAAPDGKYNEKPSFEDMIGDQLTSGNVATIDNIAEIELLSAKLEPQFDKLYFPSDAWIISLKIKNLYGASIHYGQLNGIVRNFEIISDLGMYIRTYAGQDFSSFAEGALMDIPPGGEATWDFASMAQGSPNSALLTIIQRAYNDPAYNNGEPLYSLHRLPPP